MGAHFAGTAYLPLPYLGKLDMPPPFFSSLALQFEVQDEPPPLPSQKGDG